MTIALIGDLHFGMRINDDRFIEYQISEWKRFIEFCAEKGIRRLIVLGDFFDNRNFISVKILDIIINIVQKRDMKMFLLVGNHDTLYKNTNEVNSPALVFKNYENVQVVDTAEEIELDGIPCLFLPWINKDNWDSSMTAIKKTKAKYCFAHLELQGFEMTSGIKCIAGLNVPTFKKFKQVYTGHFHLVQKKGNIFYLGSFYQTTWADCGDQKFIYTLDGTAGMDFVIKQLPMARSIFKKMYFTEEKPITKQAVDDAEDCYVKVYINYKMSAKDEKLLSNLMESAIKCSVIDTRLLLDAPDDDIAEEDFLEIFEGYMELQDDLDGDLKDGVMKLMKETYHEALNG